MAKRMEVERSIEHIALKYDQLLSLIQRAFPTCSRVDEYDILLGGAQNTTYRFKIKNQEFVLRLYSRRGSHCKIEKELHALIDSVVPTAQLIYSNERDEPWPYAIFEFISGLPLFHVSQQLGTPLSFELGKVLALIHSFKFSEAGLFGDGIKIGTSFKPQSSPYFEEAFAIVSQAGYARARLGEELADAVLAFMLKNQDFFPRVENNICLTHSDFKPVNLIYDSYGKVIVLDWEFAHAGIGLLDFAILLRHRDQFPLDLIALEKSYLQHEGNLPDEWLRSAMITDFVNMVTMMETATERPKLFRELKQSIKQTMHHWNDIFVLF